MAKQSAKRVRVEASSGNVFADLGLPDASELDTKARLAVEINRLIVAQRRRASRPLRKSSFKLTNGRAIPNGPAWAFPTYA